MGRRAVLVDCVDLAEALALAGALASSPLPGQRDVRVGARTVLVVLADATSAEQAAGVLTVLPVEPEGDNPVGHRVVTLDVVYDGEDLREVAASTGRSTHAVVAEHTGQRWTAAFGGFAPGFVYLAGSGSTVPRRASPRTRVPAGAVAVGGEFSAVYPRASPGGWQLLGTTAAVLWDVTREPPELVHPGDLVRFVAVRPVIAVRTGRDAGTTARVQDHDDAAEAVPAVAAVSAGGGALVVVDPGALSLVEDLGRPGNEGLGVPPSGAADRGAAVRANRLVGNPPGEAVVETLGPLACRADGDLVLVVTGAPGPVSVHAPDGTSRVVEVGTPFALPDGAQVRLGSPSIGMRRYLAVRGGLDLPLTLGSRSTDVLSGLGPLRLAAGAVLPVSLPRGAAVVGLPELAAPWPDGPMEVPVALGPRTDWFTAAALAALCSATWVVSDRSDRVGLRLVGPRLERTPERTRPDSPAQELASEPMVPGAVQVPPSGEPVVLLVDHPVTGGYPVVAVVLAPGRDLLAQAGPGRRVRFCPVGTALEGVSPVRCPAR